MKIRKFKFSDLASLVNLYNNFMNFDPDFVELNEESFKAKFIDMPFCSRDLIFVAEQGSILGCIFADVDPLMEEKFKKRIAVIDLLLAKREVFHEVASSLLDYLTVKLRDLKVEEIQVHFVAENLEQENSFYRENFELSRVWYYMEAESRPFMLEDLPEHFSWQHLKFKGRKANARKWIECYNEVFKDHPYMRPLRYEELKIYSLEENFDPTGYFGIFKDDENKFIAECSCEAEPAKNKGVIWTVGVLKEYRNRGLGELLVKKAIDWIYNKGLKKASIHVDSQNEIAFKLYSKLGFKPIRRRLFYSKIL